MVIEVGKVLKTQLLPKCCDCVLPEYHINQTNKQTNKILHYFLKGIQHEAQH